MKTTTKTMMAIGMLMIFTACGGSGSGGGGGSAPSYTAPSYVKPAKIKCGSKDCISGAAVSGFSTKASAIHLLSASDDAYTYFKSQYDAAKLAVAASNDVITLLNQAADDNSITSCDDIPTSGTVEFGGYTLELGSAGETFNIGNGSVTTDHTVKASNDAGDKVYISFKCGTTQSIHIITKANTSGNLYEYFYQVNADTNAITLEYGSVLGTNKSYGYFKNDGTDAFTFGLFMNNATGNSPNAIVGGAMDYTSATSMVTPASAMLSFAFTAVAHEDIDAVSVLNNDTNHVRACVTANRTSVVSNSCANQANVSGADGSEVDFSVGSVPNLIGNASTWTTDDVMALSITDPESL